MVYHADWFLKSTSMVRAYVIKKIRHDLKPCVKGKVGVALQLMDRLHKCSKLSTLQYIYFLALHIANDKMKWNNDFSY